jgi:hypothetical protein
MSKCVRWDCPTIEVDPLKPIEPIEDHHDIFIGIGVAAAFVLLVICGIVVIIQNRTNTTRLQ